MYILRLSAVHTHSHYFYTSNIFILNAQESHLDYQFILVHIYCRSRNIHHGLNFVNFVGRIDQRN
jgi:hypothetical protein